MKGKKGPRPDSHKKRKSKSKTKPTETVTIKRVRQARLPGMEDSPIKDLEDAAIEHSETASELVRERAAGKEKLKEIDERIRTLMKREGKKTYNRAGISLKLREGEESVSVKVKRHEREEESDDNLFEA